MNLPKPVESSPVQGLRIAIVTDEYLDPSKVNSWSGTPYFLTQKLKQHGAEVQWVPISTKHRQWIRWALFLGYRVIGKRYPRDRDEAMLRDCARQLKTITSGHNVDVVLSLTSTLVAFQELDLPVVFYTDATFAGMRRFYASFSQMPRRSEREGELADRSALQRCAAAIYPSEWAAKSAVRDHGADPGKVHVVPFGANLLEEISAREVEAAIQIRSRDTLNLLFIGVDWRRKGAEKAFAVAAELNKRGLPTTLHLMGCELPKNYPVPANVVVHGFISKETAEGRAKITQTFLDAHFFILPTAAEAYGLVFCEAAAHGVPVISHAVGGVPTIVQDEVNGHLFDQESPAQEMVDWMEAVFRDEKRYLAMARASRKEYEDRLNWDVNVEKLLHILRDTLH